MRAEKVAPTTSAPSIGQHPARGGVDRQGGLLGGPPGQPAAPRHVGLRRRRSAGIPNARWAPRNAGDGRMGPRQRPRPSGAGGVGVLIRGLGPATGSRRTLTQPGRNVQAAERSPDATSKPPNGIRGSRASPREAGLRRPMLCRRRSRMSHRPERPGRGSPGNGFFHASLAMSAGGCAAARCVVPTWWGLCGVPTPRFRVLTDSCAGASASRPTTVSAWTWDAAWSRKRRPRIWGACGGARPRRPTTPTCGAASSGRA
jgi:hypothetical protein